MISVSGPSLSETFVYDGDGNRVSQTINGVTTNFLVDTNNLTGYAQVLEEIQGSTVQKAYNYGVTRISQDVLVGASYVTSYYGYDGQGSVRFLMDSTGNVTDQYTYSSFGENLFTSGSTTNSFQYDGEQIDVNTGLDYLRTRYLNPGVGRFLTFDSFEGEQEAPGSLHKYLFVENDPGNKKDPFGNEAINNPDPPHQALRGSTDAWLKPVNKPYNVQQLLNNSFVKKELTKAWNDSKPFYQDYEDDLVTEKHEEGGWIYENPDTKGLYFRRKPRPKNVFWEKSQGEPNSAYDINLGNPPILSNAYVIAFFNTHPFLLPNNGPAPSDIQTANYWGVPGIVAEAREVFFGGQVKIEQYNSPYGPDSRYSFSGSRGYPNDK